MYIFVLWQSFNININQQNQHHHLHFLTNDCLLRWPLILEIIDHYILRFLCLDQKVSFLYKVISLSSSELMPRSLSTLGYKVIEFLNRGGGRWTVTLCASGTRKSDTLLRYFLHMLVLNRTFNEIQLFTCSLSLFSLRIEAPVVAANETPVVALAL